MQGTWKCTPLFLLTKSCEEVHLNDEWGSDGALKMAAFVLLVSEACFVLVPLLQRTVVYAKDRTTRLARIIDRFSPAGL